MSELSELKPCPCGKRPELKADDEGGFFFIECACGNESDRCLTVSDAIADWNNTVDSRANLAAAATDLYAALLWMMQASESVMVIKASDGSEIVHPAFAAARAAVAKAEGKT